MTLTAQQKAIIKADILANADLNSQPNTADGAFAIAEAYQQIAVPAFFIWKPEETSVTEIMGNGFDWVRVDNLSVGKARIWEWMALTGTIKGYQANVRQGVLACFSVSGGDAGMRLAIFGHLQRTAKRIEKLFSTGVGTTTTDQAVGPGTTMWTQGNPTYTEILEARNS